ncbi:M24 family metallopeptidase [Pseudonocardia sp. C8]|uniref:M24 family metallopeptidase n=1 Tax=Pseudonocardia sp. C8 TaxID=2762759 RepID=UPI001642C62E|nr:M24 family metallopeptidase [Pseudonocardia sp. C8]MBC3191076.1 M24 family metallopeptidase [Pseudonocardia sp. C8]
MTLRPEPDEVAPDLGAAVAGLVGRGPVEVDPELPLARYREIARHVELYVGGDVVRPAVAAGSVGTGEVSETVARAVARIRLAAAELIEQTPSLRPLAPYLEEWSADTRFTDLDEVLARTGADAVLTSSPIGVEELCALPGRDGSALYRRGSDSVEYGPSAAVLVEAAGVRRVLVEEWGLGIGEAEELQQLGVTLVDGSHAIAKWRERRDHQYLPAVVVVARATGHALDSAVEFARDAVARVRPITENDVRAAYLDAAHAFADSIGLTGHIHEFFTNCHAGDRSIHPCLATDHPVGPGTTSLKLDAGLAVVVDGLTLATSDAARTFVSDPDAERAYEILIRIVRSTISEQITEGAVFADVHRRVVDQLVAERDGLVKAGFWPEQIDLAGRYALRNVGHLMGRQESFSSEFRPGDREVVRVGDFGACEIQWPIGEYSIGAEDMWLVLPSTTVNLTQQGDAP